MRLTHVVTSYKPRLLSVIVIGIVTLFICLTLLVMLTVPVLLGENPPGDMALVLWAISLRNDTLTAAVQVLTFFGSATPALVLCVLLSGYEFVHQVQLDRGEGVTHGATPSTLIRAAWPLVAFAGMMTCNIAMRIAIGRLPPQVDYLPQLLPELQADFQRYSFPSGHAGSILVAYGALTIMTWRAPVVRPVVRWLMLVCVAILVIGVGFGRVYLGVHWPSDVLAGYLLGATWLAFAQIICRAYDFNKEQ